MLNIEQTYTKQLKEMDDKIEEQKKIREDYEKKSIQLNIEFTNLMKQERSLKEKKNKPDQNSPTSNVQTLKSQQSQGQSNQSPAQQPPKDKPQ